MDQLDLSDFFITKSQADDFSQRLTIILDAIYTTNFNLEKVLTSELGMRKKDACMKLLRENKIDESSTSGVQEFFKKIQETMSHFPLVLLTIAFEPTNETLTALSQWFLFTLKKHVILDIHTDRNLIAGATVTYNGRFKNYSLNSAFTDIVRRIITPPVETASLSHQSTEHIIIGR